MIKLLVGAVIGFFMASDLWMVCFCVWYEKRFPEAADRLLRQRNRKL